jgi:hypothetical protein
VTLFPNPKPHDGDPLMQAFAPRPLRSPQFDGKTFSRSEDGSRLLTQQTATERLMHDGCWRTLPDIQQALRRVYGLSATEQGVSARVRDLRKAKFGGYEIERRRRSAGVWEYRMVFGGTK